MVFVPIISVCSICGKPISCTVKNNNTTFCVNCDSEGNCLAGRLYKSGNWCGGVSKHLVHFSCSKKEKEQCLDNALFVAT